MGRKIGFISCFLIVLLFSCSTSKADFAFREGRFKYSGEPIDYYYDIVIEDIIVDFRKTSKEININCIQNKKTKEYYEVDMLLKVESIDDYILCPFKYNPKGAYHDEHYSLEVDLSKVYFEKAELIAILFLDHNSLRTDTDCIKRIDFSFAELHYRDEYLCDSSKFGGITLFFEEQI